MITRGYTSEKAYLDEELEKAAEIENKCRKGELNHKEELIPAVLRQDDLREIDRHLQDMALLVKWRAQDTLPEASAPDLCRMYTRNGWDDQKELLGQLLKRVTDRKDAIESHLKVEQEALKTARSEMIRFEPFYVRAMRYRIQYVGHKALYYELKSRLPELAELR
jgi:hypothetical protein